MSEPFDLDQIDVAAPCSMNWEAMQGDARVRFCDSCQKRVYNLSGMARGEAVALIREHEGPICVRLYRREDGTILTNDCPLGLKAMRRRAVKFAAAAAGILLTFVAFGASLVGRSSTTSNTHTGPLNRLTDWVTPAPQHEMVMGKMVCPTTVAPVPPVPVAVAPPAVAEPAPVPVADKPE